MEEVQKMKRTGIILSIALAAILATAPASLAGEYKGSADGPFMSVELIEVNAYGNAAYYEYLGKGYIPLLEKVKAEGLVLDYGVLEYQTGQTGEGNVVIWWTAESMDAMQQAGKMMGELVGEMRSPEEWKEMTDGVAKVRTPLSTNIARALIWTKVEEEEAAE